MPKTIRCALYDRVSTDSQVENGISLDTQRDALTEYAHKHGYQIVGYYSDEGITARKKMQNRKELLRLLDDVRHDKIDLILVTKLDRWFRNIKDYHNTQAILEAHNCNWKTIFEDYDTSTSNGRFAINIMLSVNENECDRDSERIKSVFSYKKKNRELVSGAPAYGYITKDKKLVKDPATKHIVEDVISYYFMYFSKRNTIYYIQEKYKDLAPSSYKINRILVNICRQLHGNLAKPCLRISHGRSSVPVHRTKIPMTIHQRISGRPLLSHIDQCSINGTVTVGMVFTHGITDDTGAFPVGLVRSVVELNHGIEHPPLDGL